MADEVKKANKPLSAEVQRVARKLQELVDQEYRGNATVVFHPPGVIKGVEIIEFFYPDGVSQSGT